MAARTKVALVAEARKVVGPFRIDIQGSDTIADLGPNAPQSLTVGMAVLVLLLMILEVLLNIRQGETA